MDAIKIEGMVAWVPPWIGVGIAVAQTTLCMDSSNLIAQAGRSTKTQMESIHALFNNSRR
jgi:hypothetical protein